MSQEVLRVHILRMVYTLFLIVGATRLSKTRLLTQTSYFVDYSSNYALWKVSRRPVAMFESVGFI